ncbi:MAG: HEPN domain-containing protein [Acidobacteria bacterium]|nr:HEPN domain-containing protein [Acidobacteriota bacterium]
MQEIPQWLKYDEHILTEIGRTERQLTLAAKHALVAEYYANSLGFPDPDWKGAALRSIQKQKFQAAFLATMAIWLIQPSEVCFTVGFHALTLLDSGQNIDPPHIIQTEREGRYYCCPRFAQNQVLPIHVIRAAEICSLLDEIPRRNAVWAALRAFSAALQSYPADYRYPLFWQGLESLFTSESKTWKVARRLCERISVFLADKASDRERLFEMVEACYDTRSKIIHGRWDEGPEMEDRMADTENIARTVVRRILERPGMTELFVSPNRDALLESLVQSKGVNVAEQP